MLYRDVLEELEIRIIETGCGREAYQLFSKYKEEVGLILLDIWLPGLNGWNLVEKIRQIDTWVPVFAISAIHPSELALKYEASGFTGFISKPIINTEEFRNFIKTYF